MKRELFHSRSIERVMKWPARCASSAASFLWIGIATGLWLLAHSSTAGAVEPEGLPRLISLNPSLTAIVFRLGAGEALVGVDDYSTKLLAEAAGLPRVGGLFDPSLEAVVALQPDRVLIVAGIDQQSHADRLARLGLKVDIYQNERLDQVLENITRLGRLVGREDAAAARIRSIVAMRSAVAKATRGRPRPATLAIVDRSPLYLVGGETFLDEMLEAVGANNLGRTLTVGYPRASIEWLIAARPELLLDMTPGAEGAASFWSRWPSLPAVSSGRVMTVEASRVSLPGPDLDAALRELAVAVHGPAIDAAIDAALSDEADEADEAPSAAGDRAVPFAPARAVPPDFAVDPSRTEVTP